VRNEKCSFLHGSIALADLSVAIAVIIVIVKLMNAFEEIAAHFFEAQGYWTRVGLKIDFDKAQKRALGNPSMPRPEIDVIAFKPGPNELLVVECKSYLDSDGVRVESFEGEDSAHKDRFKLFNLEMYRQLVAENLVAQLKREGLLLSIPPTIRYVVVAGKIKSGHELRLRAIFEKNGWQLVTPTALAEGLRKFAQRGYEDDIATMIVKILERNTAS